MSDDELKNKPYDFPSLQNDLIIRVARGETAEKAPVWIMRQAGRYLPEFKQVRADKDFFQVCRTPHLAAELTLQPIRRFPLDAAIIFSDILVIPQSMGLEVEMKPGKGPTFPDPLKDPKEIKTRLVIPNVRESLKYVFEAITLTRHKLEGKVPLIGFSGAPWTLMAYMVEGEGSKTFSKAKAWLYQFPEESAELLQMITTVTIEYLSCQVEAGAQLLQVFDSWAGELSPSVFRTFIEPYLSQIAAELKKRHPSIPLIVFAKGSNYALESLADMKYDVVGIDWTIEPQEARRRVQDKVTLQGNMDPCVLYADKEKIRAHVKQLLQEFGPGRHIANMGHGMHPTHDPEHLGWYIDAVHEFSAQ